MVTGDGARWIDSCVAEHCPDAERVLDGFRIVSWMSDALDKVRKCLWNQARHEHDEEATNCMRSVKYAVLKNPGDLTDRQTTALTPCATRTARASPAAQGTPQDPAQTPPSTKPRAS